MLILTLPSESVSNLQTNASFYKSPHGHYITTPDIFVSFEFLNYIWENIPCDIPDYICLKMSLPPWWGIHPSPIVGVHTHVSVLINMEFFKCSSFVKC